MFDPTSTTAWLWNEQFWLPENITWTDLESRDGIQYPQFRELGYTLLVGLIITIVRILVEAFIFVPIGYLYGFMDQKKV